jgi:hypothetical protein
MLPFPPQVVGLLNEMSEIDGPGGSDNVTSIFSVDVQAPTVILKFS